MKPETCTSCGQEVRWGWRDERFSWLHREAADHQPILGRRMTAEDKAEVERQRHIPRERKIKINPEGFPLLYEIETYTAAELERRVMEKDARGRAVLAEQSDDEDEVYVEELEPVECRSTPLNHKGVTVVTMLDGTTRDVTTPGGVRTLLNLTEKLGWHVVRLTYARGPYLGARGSLGVSDSVVLVVRGPVVDDAPVYGVGSWRDGKSDWAWRVVNRTPEAVGARALSAWMKEVSSGEDAE